MNKRYLISYDAAGVPLQTIEPAAIAGLGPDVVFLAHGWLNDRQTASQLFESYAALLAPLPVVGVLWPHSPDSPARTRRASSKPPGRPPLTTP